MNLVGWGGGALGPLAVGLASTYGSGSQMHRMSWAITWSSMAYLAGAVFIVLAYRSYHKSLGSSEK